MAPSDSLAGRLSRVRRQTLALVEPLSAEDCCAQSMPDASPAKWHLAHTTWFFATFVLGPWRAGGAAVERPYASLFNSYYQALGEPYARPRRGLLTRPSLEEVLGWRRDVDAALGELLAARPNEPALNAVIELGIHHEQQHQELLLTDVKHLLSCNPLMPAYSPDALPAGRSGPLTWRCVEGGTVDIGHAGDGFGFDNESPRHRVFLGPYELAQRLVTNEEFAAFIEAGGYAQPAHWLAEGWDWCQRENRRHPLYWRRTPDAWSEFTLHGLVPLDPLCPAVHLSYFEADAYARWAGARLPTEAEWEHAMADGGQASAGVAAPQAGRCMHPTTSGGAGGAAWEWTQSSYTPYPGYRPAAGAVGEYNGKFMVNQYVLRGASCVTPVGHSRLTYRNFFPTHAGWQFSGVRLARDAEASSCRS